MAVNVYTCIAMHSSCVIYINMFMQARIQVVVSGASIQVVVSGALLCDCDVVTFCSAD